MFPPMDIPLAHGGERGGLSAAAVSYDAALKVDRVVQIEIAPRLVRRLVDGHEAAVALDVRGQPFDVPHAQLVDCAAAGRGT